ncbi:MAG: tRNA epoxyqueuosine(34) reductase QueG [Gemmatimonadaceae bacterium]
MALSAGDGGDGLAARLKAQAYGLGFDLAGLVRLGPAASYRQFQGWLVAGRAGEMAYMARGASGRADPRNHLPRARSALVVALNYGGTQPSGPVARYARGADYHDVMLEKLRRLPGWLGVQLGREVWGRAYVDTGPFLERELAQRAGLGWFGKNTNLIHPKLGSFFLLGTLFLELDLEPDAPFEADRCGTCTRCLDACPTAAFVGPRELDARRCISYLTIELREAIPVELRGRIGELLFGCDICQDVCPWNVKFSRDLRENSLAARPPLGSTDARSIARTVLAMDEAAFRAAFRDSPLKRAKRRGLARNAAVVLGNVGTGADVALLAAALHDPDPLVREHASWALSRIADRGGARPRPDQ